MKKLESSVERPLTNKFSKVDIELIKFKTPSRRDVPDRIAFLDNGITIFIEVKRPGESLRKKQRLYCESLITLNHYVYVIDNTGMIDDLITEVLQLPERGNKVRAYKAIRWFVLRDGSR